jgi:hypothetical protein
MQNKHFKFLDDLHANKFLDTNVFKAIPLLNDVFRMDFVTARKVILAWQKSK